MIEISVVVPVYGVNQWIERCARSLFNQTKRDGVEFIFVDDATPDSSIDVLQRVLAEYPERTDQVLILHHPENRGLPQARKTGIEAARGQYILNVDSDDWLALNALEILAATAVSNPDIIVFDYIRSDGETFEQHVHQHFNSDNILNAMIRSKCKWNVWSKLIRRDLFFAPTPIEFPTIYMGEDMVISCQLVVRAKNIIAIKDALYFYFVNPNSRLYQSDFNITLKNAKMFQKNVERIIEIMGEHFSMKETEWLRMRVKIFLRPLVRQKGGLKEYRNMYQELNFRILTNFIAPLKSRGRHILAYFGI